MIERIRHLIDRVARLLTETDTSLAEFWGSTLLIAVAIWLLFPFGPLFEIPDTFELTPVYTLMATVMPEKTWAGFSLGLGILQAWGNLTRNRPRRSAAAFAAAMFFGFISMLALVSAAESLLVPIFGVASFVEGLVYLRLSFFREPRRGRA